MQKQMHGKIQTKEQQPPKVEYTCWKCTYGWKDIQQKEPYPCPKCGSFKITFKVM